jgi:hypothetical protein
VLDTVEVEDFLRALLITVVEQALVVKLSDLRIFTLWGSANVDFALGGAGNTESLLALQAGPSNKSRSVAWERNLAASEIPALLLVVPR